MDGLHLPQNQLAKEEGRSPAASRGMAFPTFKEWIGLYWVDILTMAAMGAVGLGVYRAPPAPSRSFPVTFSDGEIVWPQYAYPLRHEIIPIWLAAFLAFMVPFVIFVLAQIRVRSFEDLNCATFGLLFSLINAAVFQVFIKWLIGGLRPHFLAVCKPVIDASTIGAGFQSIMYDRSICTGDAKEINDALESMPSGHSAAAWAGLFFLPLYLNGKLKIFANTRSPLWHLVAFSAPLLGAFLISGALTIDEFHHAHDVVAGGIIGSLSALASYRMSYAALTDFRFNHLPLPRTGAGFPCNLVDAASESIQPFTRRGGWGEGLERGAPGDALSGNEGRGVGAGRV